MPLGRKASSQPTRRLAKIRRSAPKKLLMNYMGEDVNPPEAKVLQKDTEASTFTNEAVAPIISQVQVFQLYSNLLQKEAHQPWNTVIEEQIDCKKCQWSWASFMEFVTFTCSLHAIMMQPKHSGSTKEMD
jgi:hypothetical protein